MENWMPTPEGYADLINWLVERMEKDPQWEKMLSRLYACANRLYVTNGKQAEIYYN